MTERAKFKAAYPFQDDVLALPVANRDVAAAWYGEMFDMKEVDRTDLPFPPRDNGTRWNPDGIFGERWRLVK